MSFFMNRVSSSGGSLFQLHYRKIKILLHWFFPYAAYPFMFNSHFPIINMTDTRNTVKISSKTNSYMILWLSLALTIDPVQSFKLDQNTTKSSQENWLHLTPEKRIHNNVDVNVDYFSPDITVGATDCTIYTPGIGTNFSTVSYVRRIQHSCTLLYL